MRTTANRLLRAVLKAGKRAKPHKYSAKPTIVDGVRFHSQREAARWVELKLLEKAGQVRDIQRQQRFSLHAHPPFCPTPAMLEAVITPLGAYVVDFIYERKEVDGWREVVEEVKGYDVPFGKWKRKHAEIEYGITVEIVR